MHKNLSTFSKFNIFYLTCKVHHKWVAIIDKLWIDGLWINGSCDLFVRLVIIAFFLGSQHLLFPVGRNLPYWGLYRYVYYSFSCAYTDIIHNFKACPSFIPSLVWRFHTLLWIKTLTGTYSKASAVVQNHLFQLYLCRSLLVGLPFCTTVFVLE